MTRILVQRGSGSSSSSSSSSSQNRTSSAPGSSTVSSQPPSNPPQVSNPIIKEEEVVEVVQEQDVSNEVSELGSCIENKNKISRIDDFSTLETDHGRKASDEMVDSENLASDCLVQNDLMRGFSGLTIREHEGVETSNTCNIESSEGDIDGSQPPDPPCPPPKPLAANSNSRRFTSGTSNPGWSGSSRPTRSAGWPIVSRTSPTGSRPSSPRAHSENEGYNSADEQSPCFGSSYNELERERQFEIDIRRAKGLEVKRMQGDGNCLFRAVADQVYGDSETYDLVRQMCIDYMERERDHFSQFVTEGFTSYCKRKRRDKVYGNNLEIQAMSEMYNRPIHIYSYSTEPINIFHRNYNTDLPPIRLSYHHGNHYNSLVDPRRLNVGAGLGFSSLRGRSVDKDQVKAAIKAQQDQQIENALVAEGRFYSDLELTEKEIERMVMEASRAEYLSSDKLNKQLGHRESSTSGAEPSSSGARPSSGSGNDKELSSTGNLSQATGLSSAMQVVLSMGFSYLQAIEAYSIFGDDVDSMVCYLLETNSTSSGGGSSSSRRKGKATE